MCGGVGVGVGWFGQNKGWCPQAQGGGEGEGEGGGIERKRRNAGDQSVGAGSLPNATTVCCTDTPYVIVGIE